MHKKRIVYKIILFIVTFLICVTCMSKIAMAETMAESRTNVNQFDNLGSGALDDASKSIMGTVLKVVRIVASGMAVIMLLILGIKYVLAAPEGRASYRKVAIIYALGLVLVVYGDDIIKMIANLI